MEFLLGVILLGPYIVCLWLKVTFYILYAVCHVIAGITMFLCYVIKGIYGLIKQLWD
jgi:hypothetical protein